MRILLAFFLLIHLSLFSSIYHHEVNPENIDNYSYEWKSPLLDPFDELLISWNAKRPDIGHFAIYVSVKTDSWSPWLLYAEWGSNFQKGFKSHPFSSDAKVYQDAVSVLYGKKGESFKLRIVGKNGAKLENFKKIHVSANDMTSFSFTNSFKNSACISLDVPGLSQMALSDPRNSRFCSPTSTTAVIRFLNQQQQTDPIDFAEKSWDMGFDIFGNWVFNVAHGYTQLLDENYSCWVERITSFERVLDLLQKGYPIVVSVRSPLPGSAEKYSSGHLLVIKGFDPSEKEVLCMDPAFLSDEKTHVRYKLNDFIQAWERRGYIAYIFNKM